ncbi:MAG: C40 family peptidase [Rhodocyclaceae bacterium]|nr:C40 family peptidase [Rhodocyclaceae bacterium]
MADGSRLHISVPDGRRRLPLLILSAVLFLSACAGLPPPPKPAATYLTLSDPSQAQEAVMAALGLMDTGYRFGGANPEAGLDCSGMVSYVYARAAGLELPHGAARMAGLTRPVPRSDLRPGDLVFFNTENRPYSHVGLYIGEGRFIHAPSSRGKVQISSLDHGWFASRFEAGHSLLRP